MARNFIKGRDGSYFVEFHWGKEGWLPKISDMIMISIWAFMKEYNERFIQMVNDWYGVDLENDNMEVILRFFIETELITIQGNLTQYAIKKMKLIAKHLRDMMTNEAYAITLE